MCTSAMPPPSHIYASTSRRRSGRRWRRRRTLRPALLGGLMLTAHAVAVALALLAASSIASLIALALPWLIHRLGKDPAFGSGPLATVIQDVLTVAIYLVVATAVVL